MGSYIRGVTAAVGYAQRNGRTLQFGKRHKLPTCGSKKSGEGHTRVEWIEGPAVYSGVVVALGC